MKEDPEDSENVEYAVAVPDGTFETKRLFLKPLRVSESEEFFSLVESSRATLRKWLPWVDEVLTLSQAIRYVNGYTYQLLTGSGGAYGIRDLNTRELTGVLILSWVDRKNRSTAFEYFLGDAWTGKGLAAEACSRMLETLREMRLHRVEISASAENAKSNALARRLGFTLEGISRDAEYLHGKFWNVNRWALLLK